MEYYVVNGQGVVKKLEISSRSSASVDFRTTGEHGLSPARLDATPILRDGGIDRRGRWRELVVVVLAEPNRYRSDRRRSLSGPNRHHP